MAKKKIEIKKYKDIILPKCDEPYDVPENWFWTTMGNIGQWGSGGTPSRSHDEYYNGNIPWIKTGELKNCIIYDTEEKITELAIDKSSAKIFPINTVMIAMYGATIGQVGIMGVEATTNQACACVVASDFVDYEYIFYYAISQKNAFIKKGKGGAQPNISQEIIKGHPIPIPPINEQHRIVERVKGFIEKLDLANELCGGLDKIEPIKLAIFNQAFKDKLQTNIHDEPNAWFDLGGE